MDSNEENHGPVENSRPLVAFFYISYIIVIAFFMVRYMNFEELWSDIYWALLHDSDKQSNLAFFSSTSKI